MRCVPALEGERRARRSRQLGRERRIEPRAHPLRRHALARLGEAAQSSATSAASAAQLAQAARWDSSSRSSDGRQRAAQPRCHALLHRFAIHRPAGHSTSLARLSGGTGAIGAAAGVSARYASLSSFIARWTRTFTAPSEMPSSSAISSYLSSEKRARSSSSRLAGLQLSECPPELRLLLGAFEPGDRMRQVGLRLRCVRVRRAAPSAARGRDRSPRSAPG